MKFGIFCALALSAISAPFALAADTYKVDPVHSFVTFRVHHLGAGYTYGRFNEPAGEVVIDEAAPENSKINVTIQAEKVDTGHAGRDAHLRKADFFSAAEFPEIKFASTTVKKVDDKTWEVTGDLSLHGVTKSITVTLNRTGTGKGMQGETRTGVETSPFKIKRTDFGMTNMVGPAGDEVTLVVALEAIRQ